jgi:hypothetical protein
LREDQTREELITEGERTAAAASIPVATVTGLGQVAAGRSVGGSGVLHLEEETWVSEGAEWGGGGDSGDSGSLKAIAAGKSRGVGPTLRPCGGEEVGSVGTRSAWEGGSGQSAGCAAGGGGLWQRRFIACGGRGGHAVGGGPVQWAGCFGPTR